MDGEPRPGLEAATLRLRGRRGPVVCRIYWPSRGRARRLVVSFRTDREIRELCRSTGRLVVTTASGSTVSPDDAWDVLCWVGEHAVELGAQSEAVLLDGGGVSAELVESLRARADAEGWPPLEGSA